MKEHNFENLIAAKVTDGTGTRSSGGTLEKLIWPKMGLSNSEI